MDTEREKTLQSIIDFMKEKERKELLKKEKKKEYDKDYYERNKDKKRSVNRNYYYRTKIPIN